MVKNNSEVQNFSYFFTSISNNYFFLQKFIPSIFLELLDIGACDFLIPFNLVKNFHIISDLLLKERIEHSFI